MSVPVQTKTPMIVQQLHDPEKIQFLQKGLKVNRCHNLTQCPNLNQTPLRGRHPQEVKIALAPVQLKVYQELLDLADLESVHLLQLVLKTLQEKTIAKPLILVLLVLAQLTKAMKILLDSRQAIQTQRHSQLDPKIPIRMKIVKRKEEATLSASECQVDLLGN